MQLTPLCWYWTWQVVEWGGWYGCAREGGFSLWFLCPAMRKPVVVGRGAPLVTSSLHHQVVIVVWVQSLQLKSSPWTGEWTVINHPCCCPVLSLGTSKFVLVKSGYGKDHWTLRTGRLLVASSRKVPFTSGLSCSPSLLNFSSFELSPSFSF